MFPVTGCLIRPFRRSTAIADAVARSTFARRIARTFVALVIAFAPAHAQFDDLYGQAESLAAAGRYLEAADLYTRFGASLRPAQAPWRLAAIAGRAWALEQAGYRESALPLVVRLHTLSEDSPDMPSRLPGAVEEDYLLRKAALERAAGLPARPTLERYRARFPSGKAIAGVCRDLAREANGVREWRNLLRQCVQSGGRDPRLPRWRLELAEGELAMGDTRAAIRLWKTVVVRHTRNDEAVEAVERLIVYTGRLPIGDPVFLADLEELVRERRQMLAHRGSLVAAEALLARTRALMQGADPGLDAPSFSQAAPEPPAPASPRPVAAEPVSAPSPVAAVPATPGATTPAPAPAASAPAASAPAASAPAAPTPAASGLPAPTAAAPVTVRRILLAPLPIRGGLEDYLKPLTYRVRSVAEARGLVLVPDRQYYRYAAGSRDLADAVIGLDVARVDSALVVTVSVIYPAADVTDVFTMPWKDRPLDADYTTAARDILRLTTRDGM